MSKKKCKPGQHQITDGKCILCGKTKDDIWLDSMDEDVPTCHSPSTSESEMNLGHGFWGNSTSGYIKVIFYEFDR